MKLRRNRKIVSIILTLSMLLVLLVPLATPASAQSVNSVSRVLAVSDSYVGTAADLTIKENDDFLDQWTDGMTFRLTLTPGVKWSAANTTVTEASYGTFGAAGTNYFFRSDNTMEVTMPTGSCAALATLDSLTIGLGIDANGTSGDITVTVDPIDSTLTGGTYTFAVVKGGKTAAVAESVENIGQNGTGGIIRIDETAVGAVGDGVETVTVKLPSNFVWGSTMAAGDITLAGGFAGGVAPVITAGGAGNQSLTFTFTPPASPRASRGTVYINPKIKAQSGAAFGDVEVSISSTSDVDDADLVVAKYVDWGVGFTVKSVKDLTSGKFDDVTTDTITIEENIAGTLINGRSLTMTLPDWVKVTNIKSWEDTADIAGTAAPTVAAAGDIDGTKNDFDITVAAVPGDAGKYKFKLDLSIEANKTGDIEATIEGAGVAEQKLVIAKAVSPVSAKIDAVKEVKLGVQSQEISDIYITENIKEAAEATHEAIIGGGAGYITVTAPSGVKFAATPKAEVTEGNLTLKSDSKLQTDDTVFSIPIDSESTKASTIKISGIKLTVDRTYPEGVLNLKVGGNGLAENFYTNGAGYRGGAALGAANTDVNAGEFITGTVVKLKVADCVTPAPGETKAQSIFKINETKFTVNGVEKTMDVAPYIKGDRTFMPLRFVANAAGVSDNNITWNAADQSVLLIKGDRVVKLVIGNTSLLINGISLTMDVAPEIVDPGRTMLPLRAVAQALGCEVVWDAATQSITVQ